MSDQKELQSVDFRIETAQLLAAVALAVSLIHFLVGAWNAEQTNQRLQRIEKIVGLDEIGRHK